MNITDLAIQALADDPAPAEPPAEEPSEPSPAEDPTDLDDGGAAGADEGEGDDEGEGEGEGGAEAEPEDATPVGDDAIVVGDDGEQTTVAELKRGSLRQADYTRKTQKHAEDVEKFENTKAEFENTKAELKVWMQSMHDPDMLEAQCLEYFPDAFEKAVERRARELLILSDKAADDREKDLVRRERDHRVSIATTRSQQSRTQAVDELDRKRRDEQTSAETAAEQRKLFAQWNTDAMTAVGLDARDRDVIQLVIGAIRAAVPAGVEITQDHFKAAAAKVARVTGAKPPPPPTTRVTRKPGAKLPPNTGGKTAATRAQPGTGANGSPAKKVPMSDFLNSILRG